MGDMLDAALKFGTIEILGPPHLVEVAAAWVWWAHPPRSANATRRPTKSN